MKRFTNWEGDFDFVVPYWQDFTQAKEVHITEEEDFFEDYEGEDNFQFHSRFYINGKKSDVRIEPKQRYEIVDYKGFKYKLVPILETIEAKMHYAKGRKGDKHKEDILEMLNLKG